MRVGTDDEIYRVDAVWLGPPKATFPWRVRYVAWGVGAVVWLAVFALMRKIGFDVGVFTLAWSVVITIVLTRFLCSKLGHERPLGAVLALWRGELLAPRSPPAAQGSALSLRRVRVTESRPRPPGRQSTAEGAQDGA